MMQTWLASLSAERSRDGQTHAVRRKALVLISAGTAAGALAALLLPAVAPIVFGDQFQLSWGAAIALGFAIFALGLDYSATMTLLVANLYAQRTLAVASGVAAGGATAVALSDASTVQSAAWVLTTSIATSALTSIILARASARR
jgi:hypothetical protein